MVELDEHPWLYVTSIGMDLKFSSAVTSKQGTMTQ